MNQTEQFLRNTKKLYLQQRLNSNNPAMVHLLSAKIEMIDETLAHIREWDAEEAGKSSESVETDKINSEVVKGNHLKPKKIHLDGDVVLTGSIPRNPMLLDPSNHTSVIFGMKLIDVVRAAKMRGVKVIFQVNDETEDQLTLAILIFVLILIALFWIRLYVEHLISKDKESRKNVQTSPEDQDDRTQVRQHDGDHLD